MARDKRNNAIRRLQHESDASVGTEVRPTRTVDLTDNAVHQERTIDPVTHEPVYTNPDAVPPADMAEYPPPATRIVRERVPQYLAMSGGFSLMAIISGVLVALGVMVLSAFGIGAITATTTALVAFVGVQFVAYLIGGYTAGRMSRGAGMLHGLLVPAMALGIGALIAWAISGTSLHLSLPFQQGRLTIDRSQLTRVATGYGIAALAAMFVGGAIGGFFGTRWHRKLERRAIADSYYDRQMDETNA